MRACDAIEAKPAKRRGCVKTLAEKLDRKTFNTRPKTMDGTTAKPPPTVLWGCGKLTMSFSKKGYRCFAHLGVSNPVYKLLK